MFESLKKKFSRTSEKLEEELIEEAEKEDNLQEESGTRFSFFSFGSKKEKSNDGGAEPDEVSDVEDGVVESVDESKDDVVESVDVAESDETSDIVDVVVESDEVSDVEDDVVESVDAVEEDAIELDASNEDADVVEEESSEDKKNTSGFLSRLRGSYSDEDSKETVSEEAADDESEGELDSKDLTESIEDDLNENSENESSGFWSRLRGGSDESDDGEVDDVSEPVSAAEVGDDVSESVGADGEVEEDADEESSGFWSRLRGGSEDEIDEDIEEESDETDENEEKTHFWSRDKDKSENDESTGGLFSFVTEKTISEKHVEDILWELEMGLLEGDVAMEVATEVVEDVKGSLVGKKIKRSNDITEYTFNALRDAVAKIIDIPGKSMTEMIEEKKQEGKPLVVMFVGINGTGKTTTIGKLANYYLKKGYTPVIAASDTFRAGAIEQVTYHADNVGVKIIKHQKGSDPAAVAYDAVEHAQAQGKELVLIDTAGRMQTNTNLMDEMKKIKRVSKPDLVIFVGDALTGNDATEQAKKFNDAIDIDGVILTKADADSKGGASLSIGYVIQKPILFLGMGQGYDDIKEYDAEWMLNQLFSEDGAEVLEE